ncbi:MAG: AAA family ATPase [Pseudomonadota bacterium]
MASNSSNTPPLDGEALRLREGERRQLTALFYDLVGSTSLLSSMDPEDFRDIQQGLHSAAQKEIAARSGHLDLLMGDGGTAYFGYPDADEDAAPKAVAAGLAIVDAAARLTEQFGLPIQVRVGIATASAVFGPAGEGALADRAEIVGEAPTMAARIQAAAEPGMVVVSPSTHGATRRLYGYTSFGTHTLKGFPDAMELWRVMQESGYRNRFDTLRTPDMPIVARDREQGVLRSLWKETLKGTGQILHVDGDAGIGKSRLTRSLTDTVVANGGHLLTYQCEPGAEAIPFYPFVARLRGEILQRFPDFRFDTATPEAIAAGLNMPGAHDPKFFEAMVQLLAPRDDDGAAGPPAEESVAVSAAIAALVTIAGVKPCLVVVEDLHWADRQTGKVLDRLAQLIVNKPILIAITSRKPPSPDMTKLGHLTALSLTALGAEAIEGIVKTVVGTELYSDALGEAIAARSEGVPLFAEELARLALDRAGTALRSQEHWDAVFASPETASLQDLLGARLAGLGSAKIVAQAAAALGRAFSLTALATVLATQGLAADVAPALKNLAGTGFIEQKLTESGKIYSFRHVLFQQAAYESMLKANRKKLHRIIFDNASADAGFRAGLTDAEIARHAAEAGLFEEAVRYYLRAARLASQQSALEDARALLTTAQALIGKHLGGMTAINLELEAIGTLGPILTTVEGSGSPTASALYDRAVTLCRQSDRPDKANWFPLYFGWWFTASDFKVQRQRADVIVSEMDGADDREAMLQALHCGWATAFNTGNHDICLSAIERGLSLYNPHEALEHRTRYGGHDARVCGLGERALSSWFKGRTETAVSHLSEARDWSQTIDHVGSHCHYLDIAVMLHRYRGDILAVAETARAMREIAEAKKLRSFEAKGLIFNGWAHGLSGDPAAGREELARGLEIQKEIGTSEDFPVYIEMLGEVDGLAWAFDEALEAISTAIAKAEDAGHMFWLPELYRRQAALLRESDGDPDQALRALRSAERLASVQGAHVLRLRALADRFRLDRHPDDAETACTLLEALEPGAELDRLRRQLKPLLM